MASPDGTYCRKLHRKARETSYLWIQFNIYKAYLLNRLSPIEYLHCGPGERARSLLNEATGCRLLHQPARVPELCVGGAALTQHTTVNLVNSMAGTSSSCSRPRSFYIPGFKLPILRILHQLQLPSNWSSTAVTNGWLYCCFVFNYGWMVFSLLV